MAAHLAARVLEIEMHLGVLAVKIADTTSCAPALKRHKVPKKEPEISAKVVSSLVCMEILDTDVGAVHMMY